MTKERAFNTREGSNVSPEAAEEQPAPTEEAAQEEPYDQEG